MSMTKISEETNEASTSVDYAAAVLRGMRTEFEVNVHAGRRSAMISRILEPVLVQWREKLGWQANFDVSGDASMGEIYHLVLQTRSGQAYMGSVVFTNYSEKAKLDSGWVSPVTAPSGANFKFEGEDELPRALEQFFSSPYVGKILSRFFSTPKIEDGAGT